MSNKNYNDMMYGSWDMMQDEQMVRWMDILMDQQTDRKSDI